MTASLTRIVIALVFFLAAGAVRASDVFEVCESCAFQDIKSAIQKASAGATINVHKGFYQEGQIIIDKPLVLKGLDRPVLDGGGRFQIITVLKANDVHISGFVIQNTGLSYTQEVAGIRVIESKACDISDNRFSNTTYAIYLENSESCHISGNEIHGQAKDEASGGNGVHVWYGSRHLVEKNKIDGHRDGIYLEFSTGTQIKDNDVRRNLRYGLHFMSSSQTEYYRNVFAENGAGVAVMYSRDIRMHDNFFTGNTGPSSYGLLLKEVQSSDIANNEFSDNTVGIYMEGSNRSHFTNNTVARNGWALRIMGDCENNQFSKNDFVSNSFDVTTNAEHSWNTFSENYWSQSDGYDLNQDGISDKAYRPVSLSSVILENVDSSYILMNSFFFSLMDQVERALPTLIPEALKDERPLMKPVNGRVRND